MLILPSNFQVLTLEHGPEYNILYKVLEIFYPTFTSLKKKILTPADHSICPQYVRQNMIVIVKCIIKANR